MILYGFRGLRRCHMGGLTNVLHLMALCLKVCVKTLRGIRTQRFENYSITLRGTYTCVSHHTYAFLFPTVRLFTAERLFVDICELHAVVQNADH